MPLATNAWRRYGKLSWTGQVRGDSTPSTVDIYDMLPHEATQLHLLQ